jgi:UDP-N-acetylmuramoylalanine--D-glutamate ligase
MTEFASRADFAGRTVLVCGARVAGASAARALKALGSTVLVTDTGPVTVAQNLPSGVQFVGSIDRLPDGVDAVVTSPGLRPDHPLFAEASARGVPVFGELEFAWRIRGEHAAAWLMVTGTNGKTTTVRMLESILRAAGRRALAVGNVGVAIIDAVLAEPAYQVLAVEASSFQLHHSSTIAPRAGVILNLAPDHLDWHGSMAAYATAKTAVWGGEIAIGNADDPQVVSLLERSGHRRPEWFGLTEPDVRRWGLHDGVLAVLDEDRSLRPIVAGELVRPPGTHNQANALAAAALADAVGIGPAEIAAGLLAFLPDPHRNAFVATVAGVDYIDDSKATNPHAAAASLAAYPSVVWIAGGQLKDAPVQELVRDFAERLRGVVLLGADQDLIAAALSRHAPDVPVIAVSRTDDGAMLDVVAAAASLAHAGDAVLLAPAAASYDMFSGYAARGEAFAAAVTGLPEADRDRS